MKTPTLSDVAELAGVSYATADRVLNNRGGVADKSVRKVEDAVRHLGYVRNVAAANLSRQRIYRFAFVLPEGPNAFFGLLRTTLEARRAALAKDQSEITIHTVPAFAPAALADTLTDIAASPCDGVAVVGIDDPALAAPLAALARARVPVVSLVSDLPRAQRAAYVGIDNARAGRVAARLVGLSHGRGPGVVQVIAGSLRARDHQDRHDGFRAVLAADFPQLTLLPLIEGLDRADLVEAKLRKVLAGVDRPSAIYSLGAGNAGLIRALSGRRQRPFCVAHELVPHTRAALEDDVLDVIIDQRPAHEVATALALLRDLSDHHPRPAPTDHLPALYLRDNLPPPDAPAPMGMT